MARSPSAVCPPPDSHATQYYELHPVPISYQYQSSQDIEPDDRKIAVTLQQGVQGDCVPLPEREVSSQNPLLFPGPPQAARERHLNSYLPLALTPTFASPNACANPEPSKKHPGCPAHPEMTSSLTVFHAVFDTLDPQRYPEDIRSLKFVSQSEWILVLDRQPRRIILMRSLSISG